MIKNGIPRDVSSTNRKTSVMYFITVAGRSYISVDAISLFSFLFLLLFSYYFLKNIVDFVFLFFLFTDSCKY